MKKPTAGTSRIQQEIKQRRPFLSRQQEASVALLRTADVVRWRLAKVIEPAGITFQQYNVLRILRGAEEGGVPTLEIARRMIERTPGITRLLDRLECKKLVRRERCPSDRRQVLCWITAPGLELLAQLDEPVAHADQAAVRGIAADELTALIGLLDAVRSK